MSHGASGFAYAFSSLYRVTERHDFSLAAKECLDFESNNFSSTTSNWPDYRNSDIENNNVWPCQWCHGAGGIGLARIGMSKFGGVVDSRIRLDLEKAVLGVVKSWPEQIDTLCCGSLGNIELLSEAGYFLGEKDLHVLAQKHLNTIQDSSKINDGYRLGEGDINFNLGMFRAISGLGYTFLRQIDSTLPNILIWK